MMEGVELPEFKEHDINKYDWTVKGCKGNDEHKIVVNIFYSDLDYPNTLSKKYAEMEANEQRWESYMTEDAEVVLVAYGCSSRICKEAVEMARAEGLKLGLIRPITLWPYPVKAFEELKNVKAFVVVEINILGQMVDDVKLATHCNYPVGFVGSFFDVPDPDAIIAEAKKMLADCK